MNKPTGFEHLNFQRIPWKLSGQVIATLGVIIVFSLLWWLIPHLFLYWLLLFPLAGITWMATYGYQKALTDVIKLLQKLVNL
jgi:hypothetical protein